MTNSAFFQRKHTIHRIVSALKFLAATISNSCGFVQRPATNGLHILFSNSNYSHFLYHHSEHSRCDGEGVEGGGDARLVFFSSKTCIRTGFYSFRILAELILRFGVFKPQKNGFSSKKTYFRPFLHSHDPKSQNKFC